MKIKMTQSIRGSLNGVTVDDLKEGEIYDTVDSPRGDRLAQAHVDNYAAIFWPPVEALAAETVVEQAAEVVEPVAEPAPAAEPEPEVKSRRK